MISWESGDWRVLFDPNDGGRIASVKWHDYELLAQPYLPGGKFLMPSDEYGEYEARQVYGYDDCWPSLDPSSWSDMNCDVRDHGELVWRKWTFKYDGRDLVASVGDRSQGWLFERRISVESDALRFDFRCANLGRSPMPFTWFGHALTPASLTKGLLLPDFERIVQVYPEDVLQRLPCLESPEDLWQYLRSLPEGSAVEFSLMGLKQKVFTLMFDDLMWRCSLECDVVPDLHLWFNRRGYPMPEKLSRDEFGVEWMLGGASRLSDAVEIGSAVCVPPGMQKNWAMVWTADNNGV